MAEKSSASAKGWAIALVGAVAALTAADVLGSSETTGDRAIRRAAADAAVQAIDRTHKGDRLDLALSSTPDARARGRTALRYLMQGARSRELGEGCEPPASPYVDPQLAKLPGRCLS